MKNQKTKRYWSWKDKHKYKTRRKPILSSPPSWFCKAKYDAPRRTHDRGIEVTVINHYNSLGLKYLDDFDFYEHRHRHNAKWLWW